jgi:hypothetical protein
MFISIVLLVLGALIYTFYERYIDEVNAVLWHKEHGDYVQIGGYRLKLPMSWLPIITESDGTLIMINSSHGYTGSSTGIRIYPINPEGIFDTDKDLINAMQKMVNMQNKDVSNSDRQRPTKLDIIKSRSVTFYCVNETLYDGEYMLHCAAAKLQYRISSTGLAKWENETELILSSWE